MIPLHYKLIAGLVALAVVLGAIQYGRHWKGKAVAYNAEAQRMYEGIRQISGNAKLERPDTVHQITELGQRLGRIQTGLDQCSASVRDLAAASERQQAAARAAISRSISRAQAAEGAVARLEASARAPRPGVCLSDEVKRRWK